jgi:hypothetical protein
MLRTICAALIAAALLLPATAQAASIVGKWTLVAHERQGKRETVPPAAKGTMTLHFAKGGKFIVGATSPGKGKTQSKEGTWKAAGDRLTTVVEGKTKTMTIELKGRTLKLTDTDKTDQSIHLERAK